MPEVVPRVAMKLPRIHQAVEKLPCYPLITSDRAPNGTKHAAFGAFGARSLVPISPMPTFSTGWGVLGSSQPQATPKRP